MESDRTASSGAQDQHVAGLPQGFEAALAELEALVLKMEDGALSLDDSLRAYQRGVELARICQQSLDVAEEQVKVLQGSLLKSFQDVPGEGGA
jgi:exodeoxyribonuclease VII, small subunit